MSVWVCLLERKLKAVCGKGKMCVECSWDTEL